MQENKKFKTSRKEVTQEELLAPYNLLIEASLGECFLDSEGNTMTYLKKKGISGIIKDKKGIKPKVLKKFKNDILNIAQSYYDVIIKGKALKKEIVKNPTIADISKMTPKQAEKYIQYKRQEMELCYTRIEEDIVNILDQIHLIINNINEYSCGFLTLENVKKYFLDKKDREYKKFFSFQEKNKNTHLKEILSVINDKAEKFSLNKVNNLFVPIQKIDVKKRNIKDILKYPFKNHLQLSKNTRIIIFKEIEKYWNEDHNFSPKEKIRQYKAIYSYLYMIFKFENTEKTKLFFKSITDMFFSEKEVVPILFSGLGRDILQESLSQEELESLILIDLKERLKQCLEDLLQMLSNMASINLFLLTCKEKEYNRYNQILSYLKENKSISFIKAYDILGLAKNTIRKVITKLINNKILLPKQFDNKTKCFVINEEFYKEEANKITKSQETKER